MRNLFIACATVLAALCVYSCTDDNPEMADNQVPGDGDMESVLSSICVNWDADKQYVSKQMEGYHESYSSENILKYAVDASTYISYQFEDNRLVTSIMVKEKASNYDVSKISSLKEYEYVGNVDGANVYISESMNTMGVKLLRHSDGVDYEVIGFTPLQNDSFEFFEPIEVETLAASNVGKNSFEMNAKIDGVEASSNMNFELSESLDMKSIKEYSASVSGNTAKATANNLKPNTIYYYRAYFIYEDVRYYGQIEMVELEKTDTYEIGDPYPSESNVEGIVCSVKDYGTHGTIISLDESYLKWDVNGLFCTDYSAYNSSDGAKNKIGTAQPFGKWVSSKGSGWFGPARLQLVFSDSNLRAINNGLKKVGATPLNGFYWSSTQKNSNQAYVVTISESDYLGYKNQYGFVHQKDNENKVRAMKYF